MLLLCSALFLVPGAVVRCCVLCCFLWCSVVQCCVWLPAVVLWWCVSLSLSLSGRLAYFLVVALVRCRALLRCVVFRGAVLSRGARAFVLCCLFAVLFVLCLSLWRSLFLVAALLCGVACGGVLLCRAVLCGAALPCCAVRFLSLRVVVAPFSFENHCCFSQPLKIYLRYEIESVSLPKNGDRSTHARRQASGLWLHC